MNATCKRLLSWLVVVTMVLSMVPVMDLSNFAVTTKAVIPEAAQTAINDAATAKTNAATVIAAATALGEFPAPEGEATTISKVCPICSPETEVEWTVLTATNRANLNGHYYLTGNVTFEAGQYFYNGADKTACVNLNGVTVTGASNFGAFSPINAGTLNILDTTGSAVVTGVRASSHGAAINVQKAGATLNIYGGTYTKTSTAAAVSIGAGGTINMYGGTIDVSTLTGDSWAHAVSLLGTDSTTQGVFKMYGGEIKCGKVTSASSNILVGYSGKTGGAVFEMYGGTISGGINTTNPGGNIAVNYGGTLKVYGGEIKNGECQRNLDYFGGGNIAVFNGTLQMYGGTISGGKATYGVGGNIGTRNKDTYVSCVEIYGGKIIDGEAATGDNIYVRGDASNKGVLKIAGGQISSGIAYNANTTFTLSGDPVIKVSGIEGQTVDAAAGFAVADGDELDVSGLEEGAEIQVTGELGAVFSAAYENAATVAQYFTTTDDSTMVAANDANQLYIAEYVEPEEPADEPEVGVFDPESCGGLAYCDACIDAGLSEEEALVKWTPISGTDLAALNHSSGTNAVAAHFHYYLSDNASFSGSAITFSHVNGTGGNNNIVCLNLNGKALTTGNRAIVLNYGSTINIMDTEGGSVTGKYTGQNGAAIYVANPSGIVNIYGGTFKKTSDSSTAASVVWTQGYGGTINMYGGTIDATGVSGINAQPGIVLKADAGQTATFNLYEGDIIGAATTGDGGAVYLTARTTFNMYGGSVFGGSGRAGGNIMVYTGALNIYDGIISGGKSTNDSASVTGGNIALRDGGSLYMEGGVVCGGEAIQNGGNIALWYSVNTAEIVGGKIYGGVAGTSGANIYSNGTSGSALTIGGTAEIAGDIKTNHTTTNTLSGTPQILTSGLFDDEDNAVTGKKGYEVASNTNIVIDDLDSDAEIQVTGAAGVAFTKESTNASTVEGCFSNTTDGTKVEVNDANQLVIVENVPQVGVFEPWEFEGQAYCEACGNVLVTWSPIDNTFVGGTQLENGTHWYLSEDITNAQAGSDNYYISKVNSSAGKVCLELNGKELTVTNGRVFQHNFCYGTLNIMDIAGTAVVTGNDTAGTASVFYMNAASGASKVNVYGGTFKSASSSPVVHFSGNGGTFTMYGGTLDASDATNLAVTMQGSKASVASFVMEDGEIMGNGEYAIRVGSILQANGTTDDKIYLGGATFTMTGGTISNGALYVKNDNTATISGGTIEYLTIVDGAYEEGDYDTADADYSGKTTVTLTGAPAIARLEIGTDVVVDISDLTADAELYINGSTGVALMEANADEDVMAGVQAYAAEKYVDVVDGYVYLSLYKVAVVTADGKTFYKTTEDAVSNVGNGYIELHADKLTVTIDSDTYIDNRGYTVTVEGEGTLYAMDYANDDYNGYGSWTVAEGITVENDVINPVNGNRYIVIKNGTAYSAHRVELVLTNISLRTSAAGLYYKASYKCDGILAGRVTAYGVVLNVNGDVITQESFNAATDIYSILDADDFTPNDNHVVENVTSTEVFGIFKSEGRTKEENATYGKYMINATPYLLVDVDGSGVSETNEYVIGNVDNEVYQANVAAAKFGVAHASKSLYDVMKTINDNWETYASVQARVTEFYNEWADYGMNEWATDLQNIVG